MDDLFKVYEKKGNERIWLQDVLDDNNIPYKIVIDSYWTGNRTPTYHEKLCIFVEEKYKDIACGFINEYNNVDNIVHEDIGENLVDALPKIKCTSCGKEFDFDHPKCPFCNFPV